VVVADDVIDRSRPDGSAHDRNPGFVHQENLDRQGFGYLDEEEMSRYAWPLRFTPAVGTALIVVGSVLQSPRWLAAMALVALSGALWPHAMLIDGVFNLAVRHLVRAHALPPTPTPRRFSYFLSTILLAGSAAFFASGLPVPGFFLAGVVVVGGSVLTVTLWCLGS
jgi:hypothetical protein